MKRKLSIFIVSVLIVFIGVYGYSIASTKKEVNMQKKILITYYSHTGNTRYLAEKIQSKIGGDIEEIIPINAYPNDYDKVVEMVKVEKVEKFKPELKQMNKDLSEYDIIFVGTPVWWYTFSSPVRTFLAENDFVGKIIVPFCTHGGGGESSTFTDMKILVPNSEIKSGFSVYGRNVNDEMLENWLNSLNI